jgi:hypothetical protein
MPLSISGSRPYEQKHEHGKEHLAGAAYQLLFVLINSVSSPSAAAPSTAGLAMV